MPDSLVERQLRAATREGRALARTLAKAAAIGRGQGLLSARGGNALDSRAMANAIGRQLDIDLRTTGRGRG